MSSWKLELEAGAGCGDALVEMVGVVRARTGQLHSFAGSVLVQQEQTGRRTACFVLSCGGL